MNTAEKICHQATTLIKEIREYGCSDAVDGLKNGLSILATGLMLLAITIKAPLGHQHITGIILGPVASALIFMAVLILDRTAHCLLEAFEKKFKETPSN